MASKEETPQQTTLEPPRRATTNTIQERNNPFLGILFPLKELSKILPKISFPFLNPSSPRQTLDLLEFERKLKFEAQRKKYISSLGCCPLCLVNFKEGDHLLMICDCKQDRKLGFYHRRCIQSRRACPVYGLPIKFYLKHYI